MSRLGKQTKFRVLIVGAGPVGLVLGILLLMMGIEVLSVDMRWSIDPISKALTSSPASLELFRMLGILDELLARGRRNSVVKIYCHNRLIRELSVDSFFLMVPQFVVEQLLRNRLAELGGQLLCGTELLDLQQQTGHVVATMRTGNDAPFTSSFEYIIGCDGARSTVRQLLGIPFIGHDYGMQFVMVDAKLDGGRDQQFAYHVGRYSFAIRIPLSADHHRVVLKLPAPVDNILELTPEFFNHHLKDLRVDFRVRDPIWSSRARIYNRLAERFRHGPIFLAGDSSHLFSPIGGQGVNTGIQDALNLAWKLAMVCRGAGTESLLAGYELERRAMAQSIGAFTDELTRAITHLDRDPDGPQSWFLPASKGQPREQWLINQLAGFMDYPSEAGTNPARRLPHVPESICPSQALHDLNRLTLLALVRRADLERLLSLTRRLRVKYGHVLRFTLIAREWCPGLEYESDNLVISDADGWIGRALRGGAGSLYLVRPDRYLAWTGYLDGIQDIADLNQYLADNYVPVGTTERDVG